MYMFKGFAQINALINNNTATVAPIGELPPYGLTFAREKTTHTSTDYSGIELISFTSTLDNVHVVPDDTYVIKVLEVLSWIYHQSASGHFTQNIDNFQSQLLTQFGETIELVESGLMTRGTAMWCPAFVDLMFKEDGFDNRVKVWFAGEAFVNQYDDFEIIVVPPLDNIDDFFTGYTHVKTALAAIKLPMLMERIQVAKNGYPDTTVVTNTFEWIDSSNHNLKLNVDWTVVVYGPAGDNLDNIKEAIIAYVLSHTTKPRLDWEAIFPDIFTATEFIITPMWNHYSIANRMLEAGLYSPIVPFNDAKKLCEITCKGTGYTVEYIDRVLQLVANPYKSVSLAIAGGANNRDGVNLFNRQFKDYLAVPSSNLDFMRMSETTRDFVMVLSAMLLHAETMSNISSVPRDFTRTVRDGIVYVSKTFDRVQYLVVTKFSLNDPATGIPSLLMDGDGYSLTDGTDLLTN